MAAKARRSTASRAKERYVAVFALYQLAIVMIFIVESGAEALLARWLILYSSLCVHVDTGAFLKRQLQTEQLFDILISIAGVTLRDESYL